MEPRFGCKVSASCNKFSRWPAAFCQRLLCASLTASDRRTCPQANGLIFAKSAPVLEYQHHRRRERSLSKTWTWRRHVDARAGESGGRSAHYDGDGHVSRAAAPSDHQSSFSYTCCPYAAYLPLIAVERSEERLNMICTRTKNNRDMHKD